MTALRILGLVLMVVGTAASILPEAFAPLTGAAAPPPDLFEAVERRVRGGMVLGVGLIFFAVTAWRPWSTSLAAAVFWFMTGALAARLLGLLLDGAVAKQWGLVGVEVAVMAVAALWLWWRQRHA